MQDESTEDIQRDPEVAAALRALLDAIKPPPHKKYKINFVPMIKRAIALRERPLAEPFTAFNAPAQGQDGMRRLEATVRHIALICEQKKMTLSKNQRHACIQSIICSLPKITGPDQYAQFSAEYFKYLGILPDELDNPEREKRAEDTQLPCRSFRTGRMMIIIMARQCGKTTVIGIVIAAIIAACPQGLEIGIYAPVQRQSDIIFTEICNNLTLLGYGSKYHTS
jgi:hypothetical protein